MSKPAHKNLDNPPGQIVNKPEWPYPPVVREKRISDIIDNVRRGESMDNKTGKTYDEGYAAGYIDGKAEGFKEALAFLRGK